MRKFIITFCSFFILLLVFTGSLYSETYEAEENVLAVQEKVFHKYHELTFLTGYISNDDFYDVYPVGLSYTFNFSDHYSWEVARVLFNINRDKDIKEQLEDQFGATPEEFFEPKGQIVSHFVFRPFYGKDSVMNKRIINNETLFFIGGGVDLYEKKKNYGASSNQFAPMLSFGAAIKYFINDNFSLSFEINDTITSREDEMENRIAFGVNFGFRFNLGSRESKSDETIEILEKYLED